MRVVMDEDGERAEGERRGPDQERLAWGQAGVLDAHEQEAGSCGYGQDGGEQGRDDTAHGGVPFLFGARRIIGSVRFH